MMREGFSLEEPRLSVVTTEGAIHILKPNNQCIDLVGLYLWDSSSAAEPEVDELRCQNRGGGNPCNGTERQQGGWSVRQQTQRQLQKIEAHSRIQKLKHVLDNKKCQPP